MAFDKNNTSLGMKIIIVIFAVILVATMCLPFFSGCSTSTGASQQDSSAASSSSTAAATTVAGVKAQHQTLIDSLTSKLAADPESLTYMANLGNAYMDCATEMRSATDAADNESTVNDTYASAVTYYDQFLAAVAAGAQTEASNVSAVSVDRAVCEFYGGKADQAVSDLEDFLEGTPDYAMGWLNLGIMYQSQGDTDKAKEAYDTCIEKDTGTSAGTYASLYKSIIESNEQAAADADNADGATDAADGATTAGDAAGATDAADGAAATDGADAASGSKDAGASSDAADAADAAKSEEK